MTDATTNAFLIYDTRPPSVNGNYSFCMFYQHRYMMRVTDTATNSYNVNNGYSSTSENHYQLNTTLRVEYLTDKTYFYEKNVLVGTLPVVFSHISQTYRISFHSFNGSTGTIRLYRFRVYKRK